MSGASQTIDGPTVTAVLGATNTGKTHRAIEQMLEYDSGMLGLPLRLLAREVYDRVSARLGEDAIALVTGEEKRIPERPRYWACTVEAMPENLPVQFLCVDEIQLVSHPERGHIFTDRVLRWRGTEQTWFLGSDTAGPLLRELIPGLRIESLPRLSNLTYKGQRSVRSLPRRSAVVAFSVPEVYRLADLIRHRRGGAAVVLGALSPRARNAQVALYESGEVDYLVATDAIGMGLNLDIDHVGLAALEKFDGFEQRPLTTPELAQIVGRAGRHLRDGTFGTVRPAEELTPPVVRALEEHRFERQAFAYYRSADLDYTSIAALLDSLGARPPGGPLRRPPDPDDTQVLYSLKRRPEIVNATADADSVRLLWDICRVPNYERRLVEHHALPLAEIFLQLQARGALDETWFAGRIRSVDDTAGNIHELTARIAAARTWNYVANQAGWLRDAAPWQARTRELEERLSDALHERLRDRFVEERSRGRGGGRGGRGGRGNADRKAAAGSASAAGAKRAAAASPFAKLVDLDIYVDPHAEHEDEDEQWIDAVVEAAHEDFELRDSGAVAFREQTIARLIAGPAATRPSLRFEFPEWTDGGMRRRLQTRLQAFTRDLGARVDRPTAAKDADPPAVRGLLYQLGEGLGTALVSEARSQLDALDDEARASLLSRGVRIGQRSIYVPALAAPEALRIRAILSRVHAERRVPLRDLTPGAALAGRDPHAEPSDYLCRGYLCAGDHVLRCDVMERLVSLLPPAEQGKEARPDDDEEQDRSDAASRAASWLDCSTEVAASVLASVHSAQRPRRRRRRRDRGRARRD